MSENLSEALGLEETPHRRSPAAGETPEAPTAPTTAPPATPEPVERWLSSLLDLTRRNPLINPGEAGVRLLADEVTLPHLADAVTEGLPLVVRGCEDLDEFDAPEGALSARDLAAEQIAGLLTGEGVAFAAEDTPYLRTHLHDLARRAQVVREQSGAEPLYLTLGAMRIRGGAAPAPLFLIPITLGGRRYGPWIIQREAQAEVRPNDSLIEWLRRTWNFHPDALSRPPRDESGVDLPAAVTRLRQELAARHLDAEVIPEARVALLAYSASEMWSDLTRHWRDFLGNPVVAHLAAGKPSFPEQPVPPMTDEVEAHLTLPLPADGSQMTAVHWARNGRSFVLDGPPGTGKSQTITNLIADAITSGKRVLFVAEKEAARDVVARRLRGIGLGERCLDLGAKDVTPLSVRDHLDAARLRLDAPTTHVADLQASHLDLVRHLATYPAAVRGGEADTGLDPVKRHRQVADYRQTVGDLRRHLRDAAGNRVTGARSATPAQLNALCRELRMAALGSVRELLGEHFEAVTTLTPCLLMSPAAVARHLPAEPEMFDLVVFDEASQIRVADAVGAMGRARTVVIVGDPKQMPPADHFAPEEKPGEEPGEQSESILLEALRIGLPRICLTLHYRSRSEDLVAFSSARYYGGELATFPAPPGSGAEPGIELRRVSGRYAPGRRNQATNIVEAGAVVDEVRRLIADDPQSSLGVIALGNAQRDRILDTLERSDSPEAVRAALRHGHEPLFVKNLDHVQGDERDHILISLTYSQDEAGRLVNRFGLLSGEGGERRLNVALTRARRRMTVFASFDPEALPAAGLSSTGAAHLREYLLTLREGGARLPAMDEAALPAQATGGELASDMTTYLRTRGFEVHANVGRSAFRVDLAVRAPGGPWTAVLLDTPAWAARTAVADRDDIPFTVLKGCMGWGRVLQVYEAEWRDDPDAVAARLRDGGGAVGIPHTPALPGKTPVHGNPPADGVATALSRPRPLTEVAAQAFERLAAARHQGPDPTVAAVMAQGSAHIDMVAAATRAREDRIRRITFRSADEEQRGDRYVLDRLPETIAATQVAEQWREVVAVEGPVALGRAAQIVAARFGVRRLPAERRAALAATIPRTVRRTEESGATFLWPAGTDPASYRLVRTQPRAGRRVTEIAHAEIANAVRYLLVRNAGRGAEEAVLSGLKDVFGFGRLGPVMRREFTATIDTMAAHGEVERSSAELILTAVRPRTRPALP